MVLFHPPFLFLGRLEGLLWPSHVVRIANFPGLRKPWTDPDILMGTAHLPGAISGDYTALYEAVGGRKSIDEDG